MWCLRILFIISLSYIGESVRIEFLNNMLGEISLAGQAKSGSPLPNGGGWYLDQGERISIDVPNEWAGRFWARTWCLVETYGCLTGDCGDALECRGVRGQPPATLAEFVFRGKNFVDYYSISLLDGFNAKMMITPLNKNGGKSRCEEISCTANLYEDCPGELAMNYETHIIGCRPPCNVFKSDRHCCKGEFNNSDTCMPTKYTNLFKEKCPQAQSYRFDSDNKVYTCQASSYLVTFSQ